MLIEADFHAEFQQPLALTDRVGCITDHDRDDRAWRILRVKAEISQSVVQVNQGSLYPALHRLEQKGWLTAEWKASETGREAKVYSLTRAGRKQLGVEKDSWMRLTGAVRLIFNDGNRT